MQRIASGKEYTSLTGHAGTGKTTATAQIMRDLQKQRRQVYACAPTHKASWVMTEKMPAEARTIHSLLGLVLVPNNSDGGYSIIPKNGNRELPTEGVVLLDESSMVGSVLWEHVEEATQSTGLQWVFVGDPAQLPPVAQQRAPALDAPGGHLEQVVRQEAGNPIIGLATRVRQGQKYLDAAREEEHSGNKGVAVTSSIQSFTQSALATFRNVPDGKAPPARIITYTNKRATGYNHRVRNLLHGSTDLPPYMEGDWLMMKDTYMDNDTDAVLARNSEEVKVLGADTGMVWSAGEQWRVWQVEIERPQMGGVVTEIPLLHRSHHRAYDKKLAQLKSRAKQTGGKRRWRDYYRLKERFADAEYCFAMTAHRSQGSTFHTAYVDHQNLRRCRNPEERQSLIYVAATRPSHQLALLV
jgi:exodeoxyribonuclease-5